jgi:NADPH:quinone reductase-like Zn-dependent oxidoreductase
VKAIVIRSHGGPEVLSWEDVPDPVAGPGEVVVRVRAVALNHLDMWIRRGVPGAPFHLPAITGADVSGVLHAVGPGVEGLEVGAEVLVAPGVSCGLCAACAAGQDHLCPRYTVLGEGCDGGMAEYVKVPAANAVPKPANLSHVDAAAMSLTFLTAWHMLVARAELRATETVLVHAAGSGVGTAAIQIARFLGAHVIATASSEAKLEAARGLGAHEAVSTADPGWPRRVKALTGGRGVDVVFEHVGGAIFEDSLKVLARAGRLVTCGATAGVDARVNLRHVFFKSLSILGSTMGSRGEFHHLVRLFAAGVFRPVVDRVMPLSEARAAHEALERREVFGKVVLTPG